MLALPVSGCGMPSHVCEHCNADKSVSGCPKQPRKRKAKAKLPASITLWPPKPSRDSWYSDTANEGLYFCFGADDQPNIVDYHGDYHGWFIIEPSSTSPQCFALVPHFVPTRSRQYLAAYRVICEEFSPNWQNPVPSEGKVVACFSRVVARLRAMGWCEP